VDVDSGECFRPCLVPGKCTSCKFSFSDQHITSVCKWLAPMLDAEVLNSNSSPGCQLFFLQLQIVRVPFNANRTGSNAPRVWFLMAGRMPVA
jgi:hypothetical protein